MELNIRRIFAFVIILSAVCRADALAPRRTDAHYHPDSLTGARISLLVKDVNTCRTVMEENPDLCVTPASVTKIITTATALELLGPDFRFETRIAHDGTIDSTGTLHGNLYIIGGGDPTLGSSFLGDRNFINSWCRKIRAAGIRHITGNIIADSRCYDRCAIPISWCWEDMGTHYAPGVYGLSAYDNACAILLESGAPGTKPRIIGIYPDIPGMTIECNVSVLPRYNDSVYVFGVPREKKRYLEGGMPANRNRYPVRCDIGNPPLYVAESLHSQLPTYGVHCDGRPTDTVLPPARPLVTLFTYESTDLAEIIRKTNFKSNNMYAEHIFRQLGLKLTDSGSSCAHSASVIRGYWEAKGIDFSAVRIDDGSGLSPQNAYSARLLTDILCAMRHSPNADAFVRSLPVAGKEGTVAGFLRGTPLEGKVRAKSGSMSNVQCYAGYITDGGKEYAFAILVNFYGQERKEIRRAITSWLTEAAEL